MSGIVYGTDLAAVDDLPDPEATVSEGDNAAYACARRLMTPDGALAEIGETEQYTSLDVHDWLGGSYDLTDRTVLDDLASQATAALQEEPFAAGAGIVVTVSFAAGVLTLVALVQGVTELFKLVVASGAAVVTSQMILPGQG